MKNLSNQSTAKITTPQMGFSCDVLSHETAPMNKIAHDCQNLLKPIVHVANIWLARPPTSLVFVVTRVLNRVNRSFCRSRLECKSQLAARRNTIMIHNGINIFISILLTIFEKLFSPCNARCSKNQTLQRVCVAKIRKNQQREATQEFMLRERQYAIVPRRKELSEFYDVNEVV